MQAAIAARYKRAGRLDCGGIGRGQGAPSRERLALVMGLVLRGLRPDSRHPIHYRQLRRPRRARDHDPSDQNAGFPDLPT